MYEHFSDLFGQDSAVPNQNGLLQGYALLPLLFNFTLRHAIRNAEEK